MNEPKDFEEIECPSPKDMDRCMARLPWGERAKWCVIMTSDMLVEGVNNIQRAVTGGRRNQALSRAVVGFIAVSFVVAAGVGVGCG